MSENMQNKFVCFCLCSHLKNVWTTCICQIVGASCRKSRHQNGEEICSISIDCQIIIGEEGEEFGICEAWLWSSSSPTPFL